MSTKSTFVMCVDSSCRAHGNGAHGHFTPGIVDYLMGPFYSQEAALAHTEFHASNTAMPFVDGIREVISATMLPYPAMREEELAGMQNLINTRELVERLGPPLLETLSRGLRSN